MVYVDFVVQPPSEARPGDTLNPTPVVKLSNASVGLWAYATLLNDNGQVVQDLLSGTLTDSAQPLPNINNIRYYPTPDRDDSYVAFPDLEIRSEGYFRIRVTVMSNSSYGTSSLEEVESRTITVHNRASGRARLDREEEGYLQALRADGRDV